MRPLLLSLLLIVGCAGSDPAPETRVPERYSIDAFMEVTNYSGASFSPDMTQLLVTSDESGISNAYAIPIEGGEPTQLTFSEGDAVRAARYFPDDERILYMADQGGNERFHVYVRELDGTVRDLTPGEGDHRATFAGWSHDGEHFYISSNERDARYPDIYRYAVDGYERELIFENNDGLSLAAISNDGRMLALQKTITRAKVDVWLYDTETGSLENITESPDNVVNLAMDFLPDGSALLIASDGNAEFTYLEKYDLETGQRETVLQPDWDVMGAGFSHGGKYLVVRINNDARTEIRIVDTATNQLVQLPRLPAADIPSVAISRDESTIAFYMSRAKNPRDLFVHEIGADTQPTQLTRSLNPAIAPEDLVEPKVVRFDSYDGMEIPGILYRPHGATADDPAPALVWVHGGPGGQSRVGYNNLIQYMVNHGYVVYAINNRGSSGYGKTFFAADDRKHGEADLGDCIASKQMLIDTGYVDPERIGIIGGSYGGYMVLAAMAFEPDAFKVGVDIFGVANWERTLTSIPAWWEAIREALYAEMGDPETDIERLRRISPVFHAGNIKHPLMVLQGANDPRVLKAESDDMVAAARANGATVEYVIFDDEGHGFAKKENQREGYSKVLAFLDEHLKGVAPEYEEQAVGEAAAAG